MLFIIEFFTGKEKGELNVSSLLAYWTYFADFLRLREVWFKLNCQNLYFFQLTCFALNLHYLLHHCFQIFSLRLMIWLNFFLVGFEVVFLKKNHQDSPGLFEKSFLFIVLTLDNFDYHLFGNFRNLGNLPFLFIINYQFPRFFWIVHLSVVYLFNLAQIILFFKP
jgi:hypothetical protein